MHRLASEAVALLDKYARRIRERHEDLARPHAERTASRDLYRQDLASLREAGAATDVSLEEELQVRISRVLRAFRGSALAEHLHSRLDDLIVETDFRKEEDVNKFKIEQINAIHEWLDGPGRPQSTWTEEFESYKKQASGMLSDVVGEDLVEVGDKSLDLNDLEQALALQTRQESDEDAMQRVLDTAAKILPFASAAAAAGGAAFVAAAGTIATAGVALIPIGVALGLGGAKAWKDRSNKTQTYMDKWREEEREALDRKAEEVAKWFELEMTVGGEKVRDAVRLKIREMETSLKKRIAFVESQMTGAAARATEEEVTLLGARLDDIRQILSRLSAIIIDTAN